MSEDKKLRRGLPEMQKNQEERDQNRSNFSSNTGTRYFKWDAGEKKAIRFLTEGDQIIAVNVHEFVTCHDGSKRTFVCADEFGPAGSCELCGREDIRRREIGFGLAVWRVKRDDGTYGTKGVEVEVEENGSKEKKTVPWVGIVQQAPRNFWTTFYAAYDLYGTIRDRDYVIVRVGDGMGTEYKPFPEEKNVIPDLEEKFTDVPDLEGMLSRMGSQEYRDKWLRGIEPNKDSTSTPAPTVVLDDTSKDADFEALKRLNAEIAAEQSQANSSLVLD